MTQPTQPRGARCVAVSRPLSVALLLLLGLVAGCERHDPAATAREYIAKGDYESAAVHLRSAVQAAPQSAELRVLLADAQERKHELAAAEENLTKALEYEGDANRLVPRLALIQLDRNELEAVVRAHRETRLTDPAADSSLRGTVALALLGLQRTQPARTQLDLATQPAATVTLARAQLLLLDGKPREALALLDLDGANRAAPYFVLRAAKRIAQAAGEPDKALDYMKRATEAVPWHGGVLGEYGEALVSAGRFDEAAKVHQQLRQKHPGLFWTHYLQALLFNREQRFEEAHAAALRALRVAPENTPAQLAAATAEIQKGDLLVAEKRLESLLRKHADSAPGWTLYAMVQGRNGRPKEQAKAIQRGLELAPGDVLLLSMRADQQMAGGDFKAAQATLQSVLAQRPNDLDTRLKLAQARHKGGDKPGALRVLEEAATAASSDTRDIARAVSMAVELGNTALARKWAEQSLARRPDDALARLSLAAVQSAQNDRAGAWATTLQVLDKEPGHGGALAGLNAMARQPAEQAEVVKRYQAAVDAGAQSPGPYLEYARRLSLDKGGTTKAQAVLERGVQVLPTALTLRDALVEWHLRSGAPDKAVTVAQAGAAMANAVPEAGALLASTYERAGQPQQAAETWRKLVSANPQRGDWRLRLAQLDASLGREADATKQLRALIEERPFEMQPYLALAGLQARQDVDAALATARKVGEQPGWKTAGLLLAGDVLATAGRTDQALEQFDAAAKAGAGPKATARVVQLLERAGRKDAAERELESALRKSPEDPTLVSLVAARALARGDAPKAVSMLAQLATKDPSNPYLLNDLAWAQVVAGRPEALGNAQRAAAMLPSNGNVLHTLGMALAKAGQRDNAVLALRAATHLSPQAAMPRLHLAQQQVAAGDKPGAAQTLRNIDAQQLSASDKDSLGKLKAELGMT